MQQHFQDKGSQRDSGRIPGRVLWGGFSEVLRIASKTTPVGTEGHMYPMQSTEDGHNGDACVPCRLR